MPPRSRVPFAVGDPLRGVAALAVAVSHVVVLAVLTAPGSGVVGPTLDVTPALGTTGAIFQAGGTAGVSIFFVLSGYLLSRPFMRSAERHEQRPSLRRYVRNRLLRIVPAYWAMFTIVLVLAGAHGANLWRIVRTYAFDADWTTHPLAEWLGQAWTLDVEMRFYLLLPLAGLLLIAVRRLGAILAVAAAILVWSSFEYDERTFPAVLGFAENVGRFMPGIALAALESSAWRGRTPRAVGPALFAAGAVVLVAASVAQRDIDEPLGWATNPAIALAAGAIVAGPLLWQWSGRAPWRALDNRVLHWAGQRSYSIYLVHFAVYIELGRLADLGSRAEQMVLLALAGLPLSLLAAEALHRAVERPFLRRRAPSQSVPA